MRMTVSLSIPCLAAALAGCGVFGPSAPAPLSGIEPGSVDAAVRPQDDFYRHVNGGWIARTAIPADKAYWAPFAMLRDQADGQVRAIIEESAATKAPAGTEAQKIGDFYASFMDEPRLEQLGLSPLAGELARIETLHGRDELPALFAHFLRIGVDVPFDASVIPDAKDSSRYIAYIGQSGLGMPDRDYYLSDEPRFKDLRAKYLAHVEKMLTLANTARPAAGAQSVLEFETALAKKQWTRVDNRNIDKIYNRYELAALDRLTPGFAWKPYLAGAGLGDSPGAVILQPDYFAAMAGLLQETPLPVLKVYLRWHVVDAYAVYLGKAFVEQNFAFYGTALSGTPQDKPRWQRGVQATQGALGEAIGKLYVARHFPPEAKARMQVMVGNLLKSYEASIRTLDWMGEDTRQKALLKLSKIRTKIGYPDTWRDYAPLVVAPDDLVGNIMRSREYEHAYVTGKLGKPVDRDEWTTPPQTVNAFYNPLQNEIVFPAGFLRPPEFDMRADDASNYGAIGTIIGHEIGHGFDDQGSKFDGDGNLESWWTPEDRARFDARTHALIEQFDGYCPKPGVCLNGALTIGENIGDLGGLAISHKAWQLSLAGKESPVIEGLTGEQRFFMGFAQSERMLLRDEFLVRLIKTDPHAPGEYRCNGVLANVPEFYTAYGVKEGDRMYLPPEKRVKIW